MKNLEFLSSNLLFLCCLSVIVAYLMSVRMYPVIMFLSHKKNLMDEPVERSMHTDKTPTLGGVGLFITFSLSIILFGIFMDLGRQDLIKLLTVLAATIILLFLGIKDDLLVLSPRKKFMGQIISSAFVVLATDIRIDTLYGLFGVGDLPFIVSVVLSIFVFIFIINAFNLVDGIDGLAGAIAIIASLSFGIFFLLNDLFLMASVSFILIGATIGFLQYNLSDSNKLFMGDSGTLFIGFLLAYQTVGFLVSNEMATLPFRVSNAPIIVLAVLSYPILDTLRVFIIRIMQKRSPFRADRNHIHHRLLGLNLKHKQATILVSLVNILVIAMTFLINGLYINIQLFIVIVLVPLIGCLPFLMVSEDGKFKLVVPKLL